MKADTLKQSTAVYVPREVRPAPRRLATFTLVLKHVVFTVAFVLFCIGSAVAIWYFTAMFSNDSYKAVVFFLVLIVVSNVAGKYVVWCINH